MNNKNPSETILVRLPNWIGDVIMATPVLRALRGSFPDAHIIGLGKPWSRELLEGHPGIDEIMTHPFQSKNSTMRSSFNLIKRIKAKKASWGLLFPNSFGSALTFLLAGIPRRAGYITSGRRALLNRGIETPASPVHQIDYFLGLMKCFSVEQNWDRNLYFPMTQQTKEEADHLWHSWGVNEKDIVVGLNPGAAWGPSKRWLPEHFARAGQLFHREVGATIVIFGGPEEVSLAEEIASRMRNPSVIVAGKDNLRVLPALLTRCSLFITNDTGPMHIAASQKVPQVVLFGPTDPQQTAHSYGNTRVIKKDLECAPCFRKDCPLGHHQCMVGISAEQVFQTGLELLNRNPQNRITG